ncbi:MAG: OB-fold nucleic acid binding domain-containing protein [archaeon]
MSKLIGLTYEQILTKIQTEKGVTRDQIEAKVKQKLDQLSNLISKEGAAHIIANEFGVKLFEPQKAKRFKIKDLVPMLRNVEFLGKVVQVYETRSYQTEKRSGRVSSIMLGDETGLIRVTIWDEKLIDKVPQVKEGDVLKLGGAYVKENNGFKELHLGSYSTLDINPEGETIEGVAQKRELSNKTITELQENDFATINGIVVQAFEPRFYDGCPDCGKKLLEVEGKLMCKEHGPREPTAMPVFNFVMDDSTDTIRVVCFRQQAEKLLNANQAKLNEMRTSPELAQLTSSMVVGKQLKISGRTNKNIMFDRLEFSANEVQEQDPKEMMAEV